MHTAFSFHSRRFTKTIHGTGLSGGIQYHPAGFSAEDWRGSFDATTLFPAEFRVDYVRLYTNKFDGIK